MLRVPQNLTEQSYIATRWTLLKSAHLKTRLLSTWGQSIQSTQLRATQVWMTALQVTLLAASTLAQTASMAALSSWRRAFFSFALLDFLWMQAGGKQVWWKKELKNNRQKKHIFSKLYIFHIQLFNSWFNLLIHLFFNSPILWSVFKWFLVIWKRKAQQNSKHLKKCQYFRCSVVQWQLDLPVGEGNLPDHSIQHK